MLRCLALVTLVACSHTDATPTPATPSTAAVPDADPAPCAKVALNIYQFSNNPDIPTEATAVIQRHCSDDTWSVDLRRCVVTAQDTTGLQPCEAKYTAQQADALAKDLKSIGVDTAKNHASPVPAGAATPPAAGTMP